MCIGHSPILSYLCNPKESQEGKCHVHVESRLENSSVVYVKGNHYLFISNSVNLFCLFWSLYRLMLHVIPNAWLPSQNSLTVRLTHLLVITCVINSRGTLAHSRNNQENVYPFDCKPSLCLIIQF